MIQEIPGSASKCGLAWPMNLETAVAFLSLLHVLIVAILSLICALLCRCSPLLSAAVRGRKHPALQ
jgi:hypothetical protein